MAAAFFKDRFLPEEECAVSIHDRSFRFGDGVFETLLVYNGKIYDFASHKERLSQGLAATKISLDISNAESLCQQLIAKNALREGILRIIISRGEGVGGYAPGDAKPYMVITSAPKPYPPLAEIKLWVSTQIATTPFPSKTNSALSYTLAMIEANEQACDNALLLDGAGNICETASGNIFWVKDGVLITPALDLPLVRGTIRKRVLELWQGPKKEGYFALDALQHADEIFMTNTGCILAPIVAIKPMKATIVVGPLTGQLRKRLDQDIFTACA